VKWLLVLALVACGGSAKKPPANAKSAVLEPKTVTDHVVALLPPGAQIVVEIDVDRLRKNPVIGETITKALATPADFPKDLPSPPLATADVLVFASYGVGTSNAATIAVIASRADVEDATRLPASFLDDGVTLWAMGPPDWIRQLEARAAVAVGKPIHADEDFLRLRGRAMPEKAPGVSLRVTARLPFDARVALAQESGLESAPAQLSVWADVVDDFAVIIDADAVDPGEKVTKKATARLERLLRTALQALVEEPKLRALGLSPAIARARLTAGGSWIRTIILVGPAHLKRVVERAQSSLSDTRK
jgi:hypothetical protein